MWAPRIKHCRRKENLKQYPTQLFSSNMSANTVERKSYISNLQWLIMLKLENREVTTTSFILFQFQHNQTPHNRDIWCSLNRVCKALVVYHLIFCQWLLWCQLRAYTTQTVESCSHRSSPNSFWDLLKSLDGIVSISLWINSTLFPPNLLLMTNENVVSFC